MFPLRSVPSHIRGTVRNPSFSSKPLMLRLELHARFRLQALAPSFLCSLFQPSSSAKSDNLEVTSRLSGFRFRMALPCSGRAPRACFSGPTSCGSSLEHWPPVPRATPKARPPGPPVERHPGGMTRVALRERSGQQTQAERRRPHRVAVPTPKARRARVDPPSGTRCGAV